MKKSIVFVAVLLSLPALAHHNYRLRFDYDTSVTMTGVVTKFDWKNPHIEIFMDVTDEHGNVTNWTMPTAAPGVANRLGITEATVKVHIKSLLRKINATNRTQAAIWALNNGLAANVASAEAA